MYTLIPYLFAKLNTNVQLYYPPLTFVSSYAGACQLGVDAAFMRRWLQQSIVTETVQQSILDLPILKSLSGVVLLLLRQPSKRANSKFREASDNGRAQSFLALSVC